MERAACSRERAWKGARLEGSAQVGIREMRSGSRTGLATRSRAWGLQRDLGVGAWVWGLVS